VSRAQLFIAVLGVCVVIAALSAPAGRTSYASLGILLGVAMIVVSQLWRWQSRD
jgi:hypothetical protein